MKIFGMNKWREIKDEEMSEWLTNKMWDIRKMKDKNLCLGKGRANEEYIVVGKKYKYRISFDYCGSQRGDWDIEVYKKRRNNK